MTQQLELQVVLRNLRAPANPTLIYIISFAILSTCSPFLSRVSLLCLLNLSMMSLVGQEVDIAKPVQVRDGIDMDDYSALREEKREIETSICPEDTHPLGDDNAPTLLPGACVEDVHLPASPAGPAERLFFTEMLATDTISAAALAQQIHQSHRSFIQSAASVYTDDFVSARGNGSVLSSSDGDDDGLTPFDFDDTTTDENSPFDSDVLAFTNTTTTTTTNRNLSYTANQSQSPKETEFYDTNEMTTEASETDMHVDAAEKVYDTAKGAWAWGKGVMIFSPFLGLTEAVAGKIVSIAGSSLEDLDHAIIPKLQEVDDSLLNPAMQAVVKTVLSAFHKSEDIIKPIIIAILKPIGLIKEDGETTKKTKTASPLAPELTSKPMVK
jgi:hypothetical protein